MRKIGPVAWPPGMYTACQHGDRLFAFSRIAENLGVAELALGELGRPRYVETAVPIWYDMRGCCSLGSRVLVMAGWRNRVSAFLVVVDDGPLLRTSVHVTKLTVEGDKRWEPSSCLSRVSENRAFLFFSGSRDSWYCDISGDTLIMTKLEYLVSLSATPRAAPVSLSDGKLLVAGSSSPSLGISLISCGEELREDGVGIIPGLARSAPSIALLAGRFLLGFGGRRADLLDDLWVFDVQTRRGSIVWEKGDWPAEIEPFLVPTGGSVYLVAAEAYSITFQGLSELIDDDEIRGAFCDALGLPRAPKYVPPPVESERVRESLLARLLPRENPDAVLHKGKLLHFSSSGSKLLVSEVVFHGQKAKKISFLTTVDWPGEVLCCCSLGDRILLVEQSEGTSATLVSLGDGPLSGETVRGEPLALRNWPGRSRRLSIYSLSESKVILYFWSVGAWLGDISEGVLRATKVWDAPSRDLGLLAVSLDPFSAKGAEVLNSVTPGQSNNSPLPASGVEVPSPAAPPGAGELPEGKQKVAPGFSAILLGDRFLLGFGRICGASELRVADLRTLRLSFLWGCGSWDYSAESPLHLDGGVLWTDYPNHSRTELPDLSELIDDEEIRRAFRCAFGLPEAPHLRPSVEEQKSSKMCRLRGGNSFNACTEVCLGGRIFGVSAPCGCLAISEVVISGRRSRVVTVNTGLEIGYPSLSCCVFGDRILVVAPGSREMSAFMIQVEDGLLSSGTVQVTRLDVVGPRLGYIRPQLCQISEIRALLLPRRENSMWYCDIMGERLTLWKLPTLTPPMRGFGSVPIRLPDGRLLVAGSDPASNDITLITCRNRLRFERVGSIPGASRRLTSIALVGGRFVVGFGGYGNGSLDDMWVFDLQTREASLVRKKGDWVPEGCASLITVRGGFLYVHSTVSGMISLEAFAHLISDRKVKAAFRKVLKLPNGRGGG